LTEASLTTNNKKNKTEETIYKHKQTGKYAAAQNMSLYVKMHVITITIIPFLPLFLTITIWLLYVLLVKKKFRYRKWKYEIYF
jgi:membrane protein YdbS with pleckstrin-like domain